MPTMAATTANAARIASRQPTVHCLRSPIVKWLQSELSLTSSTPKNDLARNRLLRASPTLFISHRPNNNNNSNTDKKHNIISSRVQSSGSSKLLQPQRRTQQYHQNKHFERISHQVYTTCSHQLGWRCVPSSVSNANNNKSAAGHNTVNEIGSSLITSKDRMEVWDLAYRTGACNVMAVGNSAAMYLAKGMTTVTDPDDENNKDDDKEDDTMNIRHIQHQILMPLTYDAVWASTTSHFLVLSHPFAPDEPMLSALPSSGTASSHPTMVVLDPKSIWSTPEDRNVANQAAVALALSAVCYSEKRIDSDNPDIANEKAILQNWVKHQLQKQNKSLGAGGAGDVNDVRDDDEIDEIANIVQTLAALGATTSFGLDEKRIYSRSIPLAIASALLPRILLAWSEASMEKSASQQQQLPQSPLAIFHDDAGMLLLRIMASLVPGLVLQAIVLLEDHVGPESDHPNKVEMIELYKDLLQLFDTTSNTTTTLPQPQQQQQEQENLEGTKDQSKLYDMRMARFPLLAPPTTLYSLVAPLLAYSDYDDRQYQYGDDDGNANVDEKIIDLIVDLVVENSEHWNCLDVDKTELENVVYYSLSPSLPKK